MKKFNLYSSGIFIACENEEEVNEKSSQKLKKKLEKLKVGDSYVYTEKYSGREWEFERVV